MAARSAAAIGLEWLADAGGILMVGLSFPVAILVAGMPVAVVVHVLLGILARL